jgi:hypothetical protein
MVTVSPKPCVRMYPRRKAADTIDEYDHKMTNWGESKRRRNPKTFTMDDVTPYFNLPQKQASDALGVSVTSIKHICRALGLSRWPYRRPCHRKRKQRTQTGFLAAPAPTRQNSSDVSHAHFQREAPTETFRVPVNQSGPLPAHFRIQPAQSNLPSTTAHADDYMQAGYAKRNLSILQAQATSSSQAFMPRPSISHKQPPMQHQIEIGYHHRPMPEHVSEHMSGVPRPAATRQHTVLRLCQDEAPCWNADDLSWLLTISGNEGSSR